MRKYDDIVLFCLVMIFILCFTSDTYARDSEGCLTCHQYPGLVRLEKNKPLKVLHIDEAEYARSPHGKFSCRKCHRDLEKVPHTGHTQVNCNDSCHTAATDTLMLKEYDYSKMHKKEQSYIVRLHDSTSCRICHPLYPHSEKNLVRALLNMHTGFMYCEVCHLKREKESPFFYEWASSEYVEFIGEPYGTRYNPLAIKAKEMEHNLARITVEVDSEHGKISQLNIWDTHKSREFLKTEASMGQAEKKEKLAFFHRDIAKKEISVACDECHSVEGILDFQQLGFDEKKARNLVTINLKGLVTKYDTFYLPHLFPR